MCFKWIMKYKYSPKWLNRILFWRVLPGQLCLFRTWRPDSHRGSIWSARSAVDSLTLKVLCSLSWTAGNMPGSPLPRIYVQQTLALIKPDAVHVADLIEDQILNSGFTILQVSSCLEVVTCMPSKRDGDIGISLILCNTAGQKMFMCQNN